MRQASLFVWLSVWFSIRMWVVGFFCMYSIMTISQDAIKIATHKDHLLTSYTTGVVTTVTMKEMNLKRSPDYIYYRYDFNYEVNGKVYRGVSWSENTLYSLEDVAGVHFDPNNINRAKLSHTTSTNGLIMSPIMGFVISGPPLLYMIWKRVNVSRLFVKGTRRRVAIQNRTSRGVDHLHGEYSLPTGKKRRITHSHFFHKKTRPKEIFILVGGKDNKQYSIIYPLAFGLYFDQHKGRWRVKPFWAVLTVLFSLFWLLVIVVQ